MLLYIPSASGGRFFFAPDFLHRMKKIRTLNLLCPAKAPVAVLWQGGMVIFAKFTALKK